MQEQIAQSATGRRFWSEAPTPLNEPDFRRLLDVDRYRENIKQKLNLPNAIELLRRATMWVEDSG